MGSPQDWQNLANLLNHQVSTLLYIESIQPLPKALPGPLRQILSDAARSLKEVREILEKWRPNSDPDSSSTFGSSVRKLDPRASSAFKTAQDLANGIQQSVALALGIFQSERLRVYEEQLAEIKDRVWRIDDRIINVEGDVLMAKGGLDDIRRLSAEILERARRDSSYNPSPAGTPLVSPLVPDWLTGKREGRPNIEEAAAQTKDETRSSPTRKPTGLSDDKRSAPNEDFYFHADVKLPLSQATEGFVDMTAKAVLDHDSDVELISPSFLATIELENKVDRREVLKPREHRGRRGESIQPREKVRVKWCPKGSTKFIETDFLIKAGIADFDILLGRSWADLSGIFTDVEVDTLRIKLPGILRKSRSQREREKAEQEDERRRNEDIQNQQRAVDLLEHELQISGALPVSPGDTTPSASSVQISTTASTPSTATGNPT